MRLSTIRLIATLALLILMAPLATAAQQATTVYRIGRLSPGSPRLVAHLWEVFRQGLRELGYVEGQNLVMEDRYAEGGEERLRDLAAELVQLKVDVIVAEGGAAVRAAQHATPTIPIVMATTADPVGQGFIASLAHPGGNITGLSFLEAELPGKRLELLKETVPQSTRIAVLANLNRSTHRWHTLGSVRCAHGYVALSLFVRLAHATQGWPEICVYESLVV
jgi:putative ABC transport system substrate-binding protein